MEKLSSLLKAARQGDENSKIPLSPLSRCLPCQLKASPRHYLLLIRRSCFINVHS